MFTKRKSEGCKKGTDDDGTARNRTAFHFVVVVAIENMFTLLLSLFLFHSSCSVSSPISLSLFSAVDVQVIAFAHNILLTERCLFTISGIGC